MIEWKSFKTRFSIVTLIISFFKCETRSRSHSTFIFNKFSYSCPMIKISAKNIQNNDQCLILNIIYLNKNYKIK